VDVAGHYLAEKVATASRMELTAMLFDKVVQRLKQAIGAAESQDWTTLRHLLMRAQDIIDELRGSLDLSTGQIASNLEALYAWVIDANIRRDASGIRDALDVLAPLQTTWREICRDPSVTTPVPA
jgi:flagellar protein FliS